MDAQVAPELDVVSRIRAEYDELPGLKLTLPQAQRLWGLDRPTCSRLLGELVEAQYLARTRDGCFIRAEHARTSFGSPS